jgi:hypothetical protein
MMIREYILKCIKFTESASGSSILQGLGEILDPKLKSWVKNNLASDAIFYLQYYLKEVRD